MTFDKISDKEHIPKISASVKDASTKVLYRKLDEISHDSKIE